jgi:hypothetical protein
VSTYFLFDMHVPTIEDARIVDAIITSDPGAEFRVDGLTPIRVPGGVHVENPANLADLLQKKYQGILAQYPGFANIIHDDLLDGDDVVPIGMTKSGSRGMVGGKFQSTAVDVSGMTSAVTQCILVYEHYTWRYVDRKDGRIERYYVEEPESAHTARVSVNGGSAWNVTTSGALLVPEPVEQGSSVIVELLEQNSLDTATNRRVVMCGSWALIF